MKKTIVVLVLLVAAVTANAQEKIRIAIFDFKAGAGVESATVNSMSDMLINSLFSTNHYTIVERSQIDNIIKEQGFQKSGMTDESSVEVGRVMNVKAIVLGTVVRFEGEYNIDIRLVDVESGELISTAGAAKRPEDSFRSVMDNLSQQLDARLYGGDNPNKNKETEHKELLFWTASKRAKLEHALETCKILNGQNYLGRDDWKVPSEIQLLSILKDSTMIQNAEIKIGKYYLTAMEHSVYKKKKNGEIKHGKNPGALRGGCFGIPSGVIGFAVGAALGSGKAYYILVSGM